MWLVNFRVRIKVESLLRLRSFLVMEIEWWGRISLLLRHTIIFNLKTISYLLVVNKKEVGLLFLSKQMQNASAAFALDICGHPFNSTPTFSTIQSSSSKLLLPCVSVFGLLIYLVIILWIHESLRINMRLII